MNKYITETEILLIESTWVIQKPKNQEYPTIFKNITRI